MPDTRTDNPTDGLINDRTGEPDRAVQRRRAVRNALLLAGVALAFYIGFILMGALKA